MNLEYFIDNTSNKVIRIESVNSYGEIGMQTELIVNDAEISNTLWKGYQLKINGEISLFFNEYKRDIFYKDVLNLYRSEEEMTYIYLPEEDSWTDEYVNGYAQY